jgi:flagellar FliL protein
MAANEEQAPEQDVAAAEEAAPAGGLKARLPLIALVAVGLAVGGGTGAKVIGPMVAKKMGRVPPGDSLVAHDSTATEETEADSTEGAGAPAVHLLENLVLNPAGSGGSRFLLLSVAIEASGTAVTTEFQARDAELRDIILTALGSKTVDQLTDITTRDGIKTELQSAIAARFGKGAIKRLYFPQFVVQ